MSVSARLESLLRAGQAHLLRDGLKGLEKESLRLSSQGHIAQTPHPAALGSALTHPWITTDYSEALVELITPPFANPEETLGFLSDIHAFVYRHLEDEVLLATSMPIGLSGDGSIPIARYGHSNIGMMKHIYRRGLAYRYGRTMQSIAGVHFNYSVNEALWPVLQALEGNSSAPRSYIDDAYFGTIRNVHRHGWLLIYLFGNSPVICKSFFQGREFLASRFTELDKGTLYRPYATSLRMSDIGYRNDNQTSLDISLNNIDVYIASLEAAINAPYLPYEKIGVKVNGEYRQLNANILQIENEYYSAIRPKQVTHSGEKPTLALRKRGVRYLELRVLDLMSFDPAGISLDEIRFLELFVLFSLLTDSPPLTASEKADCSRNSLSVACCARGPGFQLFHDGQEVSLARWAGEILDQLVPLARIMDEGQPDQPYLASINKQRPAVDDPEQTPSARILHEMRVNGETFAEFALRLSRQHAGHWDKRKLTAERSAKFAEEAEHSWHKQEQIESADHISFDDFLNNYWNQS
jgi:glutamate--cysteine ligase